MPDALYLVRHAESEGNVAAVDAFQSGSEEIAVDGDDRRVGLTPVGCEQARALGVWFASRPPTVIWSSPYRRCYETAAIAKAQWAQPVDVVLDDRLRERSLGVLNRLTPHGIRARFPQEVHKREREGKFFYRPPQGESWHDVVTRLRSVADQLRAMRGTRPLIITHQAVILCMRLVLESLSVDELLGIDAHTDLANCSITEYDEHDDSLHLTRFNDVSALETTATAVTKGNDAANPV